MRKLLLLLCIAGQVLVLGFMAGGRELIIANGETVYVRTAPIDPRDLFRGDFVRLNYEFNQVQSRDIDSTRPIQDLQKGQVMYAVLKKSVGGIRTFSHLTDRRPDAGTFIRGRVRNTRGIRLRQTVRMKYGIEQYFVEQGAGLEIENRRGNRGEMQVLVETELAVSSTGVAVLKNLTFSKLGILLEFVLADAVTGTLAPSPTVRITLENVSDDTLVLANPGDNCGFALISSRTAARAYTSAYPDCTGITTDESSRIELLPQQQYSVELDLSSPRWFVKTQDSNGEDVQGEIARIAGRDSFRIVYTSPQANNEQSNSGTANFWLGELPSQAFNARGQLD